MLRCAITDRTLFPMASSAHPHQGLVDRCGALAREGIDLILIREKDLPAGELSDLSREILDTVRQDGAETRVILASRADIALATGLDGVHLTSHPAELTPGQVRALYRSVGRPEPAVTLSCHTPDEVFAARASGPTFILFAPVFGKSRAGQQISEPSGIEALGQACKHAAPFPVLALGGVTQENTSACLTAGAVGIAAIRLFMQPGDHPS